MILSRRLKMTAAQIEREKEYQRQYRTAHPDKRRQWEKNYDTTHPEEVRAYKQKVKLRQYGITPEEYSSLLEKQSGVCAICGEPETRIANGTLCQLAVDHDHITGKVRGLLCSKCNLVIGRFNDNPLILQEAAEYIIRTKSN